MAVLTIRNIDEAIKTGLRVQAARHGRSMEEEARRILAQALQGAQAEMPLGTRLRQHFAGVGALDIPARRPARAAPVLAGPRGKAK
jgi:plasmid stability protein